MAFIEKLRAHPIGFWFIFWGELAERAAYYGMRAILALYLTDVMRFNEGKSGMVASFFSAGCYLLCLLGGWVSDRYFGKFWTIIIFSLPYLAGYPLLGFSASETGLYVALVFLACGSGMIKPNLSPLMGALYDNSSEKLRSQAFSWFYAAINLGAGITSLTMPWLRSHYGFRTAFMSTAVLMALSLFVFFIGKKYYPKNETAIPRGKIKKIKKTAEEKQKDDTALARLAGIFIIIIFFWAVYDQTMSTWVYFARDHLNLYGLEPDQLQALNPWLIVILTPLFNWMWIRLGIEKATTKMIIGYLVATGCMGIMAAAGIMSEGGKVTMIYELAAYTVITLAELCISVVGLELAFTEAPKHMRSQITSAFLCTVFVGDILAGLLASVYPKMAPGAYFTLLALIMAGATAAFYIAAKKFERQKAAR
ncbi:MAG: oligopeptide:H+ symporter [bacterium]